MTVLSSLADYANYGAGALAAAAIDLKARGGGVILIDDDYMLQTGGMTIDASVDLLIYPGRLLKVSSAWTVMGTLAASEVLATCCPTTQPTMGAGSVLALAGSGTPTGTAGGSLTGTYPNPTLAAGVAATNIGTVGGALAGTLPNPTIAAGAVGSAALAAGAAAANIGTVSGVLTGTLPNPGLAAGAATGAALGSDVATLTGTQSLTNKTFDGTSNVAVLIATVAVSVAQANITFSSIPATYTNLRIIGRLRGAAASTAVAIYLRFNADGGANYDYQLTQSNGTTVTGSEGEAQTSIGFGTMPAASAPAGTFGPVAIDIPGYGDTSYNKSCIGTCSTKTGTGAGSLYMQNAVGWWRSDAAINTISVLAASGNIDVGSTLELWGYK